MAGSPRAGTPASGAWRYRLAGLEPWLILALTPCFLFLRAWSLWAVLALPALWLGRWALAGRAAIHSRPANLALLLIGLSIFPALRAASNLTAARQSLLYLLVGIALCWALMQRRPGRSAGALWAAALLGMALALAAFLPLIMSKPPPGLALLADLIGQWPGWLREYINPNILAGGLAPLAVFALAALVGRSPLGREEEAAAGGTRLAEAGLRLLALFTLAVSLVALVITQSRGALLAVLGGAALLALLDWVATRRWWLPALLVMATGLGLLAGPFIERALPPPDSQDALTLAGRIPIWEAAIRMIGRAPLSGVGLGNFEAASALDAAYASAAGLPGSYRGAEHAHNLFLQVAADLGLVGLAAFVALYGLSLRSAHRAWRNGGGALAMGLLGGLSAAALHGLVDATQWGSKPAFLLWLFIGLALGLDGQ
jgi:O-antigen ligase